MSLGTFFRREYLGVAVLAALAATACDRPAPQAAQAKSEAAVVDNVPQQRDADDTARFLAGMPGKPGSPFLELESTPVWQEHRQIMDKAWAGTDSTLVAGLAEFQKQELSASPLATEPVFYPFGGPDALTPVTSFPGSPSYVLVALEPPGTLPAPAQLEKKHLDQYLPALRNTMGSVLGRSFFITREMDRQFRGQVTDGLLLPILQLLVRTGHTIRGIRYVYLDDAGQPVERPAEWRTRNKHGNRGVQISFVTDASGSRHLLSYYSVNLDDKHLSDNFAFRKFAGGLRGSTTILKATSYMTHNNDFSIFREIALSTSAAILQDDSGLPYHFFDPAHWKVQLYGQYTEPYGSFRFRVQKDLRQAYQSAGVKPLPMRIGYGYGKVASNLLLARRAGS
ncbi:MAG: hypothetical protein JST11_00065 [Acidobacteria bacterium]|nr:hypothetical protein [Acidobacteriota bacterium]